MLVSMTGFGKSEKEFNGKLISCNIKALNSKFLDLSLKIPSFYKEKESEIYSIVSKSLIRGKIELYLNFQGGESSSKVVIDKRLAKEYYNQLKDLANELEESDKGIFQNSIRMPEVIKLQEQKTDNSEELNFILDIVREALEKLNNFRSIEGSKLQEDIINRINNIQNLKLELEKFENERIENIKTRIFNNLNKIKEQVNIDNNRYEQELIYYLEKFDITEEKVRLESHCKYFLETVKENINGKKLNFISQEIGREINTISSKANHSEMQKIAVKMKDELEKIKEQALNIL